MEKGSTTPLNRLLKYPARIRGSLPGQGSVFKLTLQGDPDAALVQPSNLP